MSSRILFLALFLLPGLAAAQAGRFILAVGDVVIARGASEIRAGVGTPVDSGDTIRLGPNSNAQVRLSDESIIGLRPNTALRLDEYAYTGSPDGKERNIFSLLKGGFRTVTGAIGRLQGRDRYAVRTPTATVGIRGTHYTLVHCDNDCDGAANPTASGGQTSPGGGPANGTYGGVSDGRISVENATGERLFGANEYFHVANQNSAPTGLIAPPSFLYDRLSSQSRNQGQKGNETSENMAQSGMNAESRPSETPTPPAPNEFVVTEQKTATGESTVVSQRFDTAALGFWSQPGGMNQDGGGALIPQSALTLNASGVPTAFSIPANCVGPNTECESAPSGVLGTPVQTGNATFPGSTQVVFWGRWDSGTITEHGSSFSLNSSHQAHLMYAPLTPQETIASKTGTLVMQSTGSMGTTPTSNSGLGATSISFPNISINFTSRVATTTTALAIQFGSTSPNQTWSWAPGASGTIQLSSGGAFFMINGTGSCSAVGGTFCGGATSGTANFKASGIFIGPAGDHAGVAVSGSIGTSNMGAVRVYCPTC